MSCGSVFHRNARMHHLRLPLVNRHAKALLASRDKYDGSVTENATGKLRKI